MIETGIDAACIAESKPNPLMRKPSDRAASAVHIHEPISK